MSKAAADTLEKVAGEFEGEALASLQAGREEAIAKLQAMRKETAEAVQKILETGVKQAESLKRQMVGAAELDSRNTYLRSLESAVSDVFGAAIESVSKLGGQRYEKSLAALIEEGSQVIGQKAEVWCNQRDQRSAAGAVHKMNVGPMKLTLAERAIDTIGGVVLASTDGSVRFENTFESRLERMRPTLRKEVADIVGEK